ncbi:alpha/beta fold hydrolase [Nocardioides campestrisoli]|uniref:alpha/beta fold hydrolase n=1 Tax=Nocardioides campestrisoli TaxID=2736757 RepID=UPI0015E67EE1|nr:alpha/beta hydrolase [Nocardioides campestrisoli]
MPHTRTGIAYERRGPGGRVPVVLVHAGVADRRMWDAQWPGLVTERDVVRLDLRGFGESVEPPTGPLSPVDDLLELLDSLGIGRCHLVGASFGAGVAVEAAVTRPELAESLLLSAPGGSLIAEATDQLRDFLAAEEGALADDDLDAAVEANVRWWLDGPHRAAGTAPAAIRAEVAAMQRLAFEITSSWGPVEERELDPPVLTRLGEVVAPTLVLVGAQDLDAIADTAARVASGVPGARTIEWPDAAHLPSVEHPDRFLELLRGWLEESPQTSQTRGTNR